MRPVRLTVAVSCLLSLSLLATPAASYAAEEPPAASQEGADDSDTSSTAGDFGDGPEDDDSGSVDDNSSTAGDIGDDVPDDEDTKEPFKYEAPEPESSSKNALKLAEDFSDSVGNAAIAWGVSVGLNALVNAIWPPPNYVQMLQDISQQIANEQASLNELSSQLTDVASQLSSTQALAAQGTCAVALSSADANVKTIQAALTNYTDTMNPAWMAANIKPGAGVSNFATVGSQVFGASSAQSSPAFLPGVNKVAAATSALGSSLLAGADGSKSSGLIAVCADAVAASVAETYPGGTSPAVLAQAETAYFSQLQQITGYYTAWQNVGVAMSVMGGYLATALTDPTPPTSAKDAQALCSGTTPAASWNALTCAGVLSITAKAASDQSAAWELTGAGWAQVTRGMLATALEKDSSTGYFSGAGTTWVVDLATYGKTGKALRSPAALPNSTQSSSTLAQQAPSSVGKASQYSGSTMTKGPSITLKKNSWLGLPFVPASADQWDDLLNLDNVPPYSGADQDQVGQIDSCLPSSSGATAQNCTSATVGSLMSAAGLSNGGSPVKDMIFYTGETTSWAPQEGPLWWAATLFTGENELPSGWTYPTATVATFVDSESRSQNGFSAVMNRPNAEVGDFTPNSIAPFLNAQLTGSDDDVYVTSLNSSKTSATGLNGANGLVTAPACSGSGDVPVANGPYSLGQFFKGSYPIDCDGVVTLSPTSSATSVAGTAAPSFYAPFTATIGYGGVGIEVWNYCGDQSDECPANPLFNSSGYPGWFLDGGYWPANGSATNTQWANPTPQTQYMWPVLSKPSCTLVGVTQGSGRNIGAPAVCEEMAHDFLALTYGAQFGPVKVEVDPGMKAGGGKVAGVTFSASKATSGELLFMPSNVTLSNSAITSEDLSQSTGLSLSSCTALAKGAYSCKASVPAGASSLVVPVDSFASPAGLEVSFLSSAGAASDTARLKLATPSKVAIAPGPLTGLTLSAAGGSAAELPVLSWDTPLLAGLGGITGYRISAQLEGSDDVSRLTVPVSRVQTTSGGRTSTLTLPASITPKQGNWTVTVSAYNDYGAGAPRSVQGRYGAAAPDAPSGVSAVELYDGRVRVSWDASNASPAVTGYLVQASTPAGKTLPPVTVTGTSYVTGEDLDPGLWQVAVYALNSLGRSEPALTQVDVTGTIPDVPSQVAATFNTYGQLGVSWHSPTTSIVPPDLYNVAVFAPFSSTDPATASPLVQTTVPVSGEQSIVSVPALLQLGRNWPVGPYTVMVWAQNKHGVGPAQAATVMVTDLLLNTMAAEAALARAEVASAVLLQDLEYYSCSKGFTSMRFQTGTCFEDGNWIPATGFLPAALQAQAGVAKATTTSNVLTFKQTSYKGGGANPATAVLNPDGTVTVSTQVLDPAAFDVVDYWFQGVKYVERFTESTKDAVQWTTPFPLTHGQVYNMYTTTGKWDTFFTMTVNTVMADDPNSFAWQRPTPAQQDNPGSSAVTSSGPFPVSGAVTGSTVRLRITYKDWRPGTLQVRENGEFLYGSGPQTFSDGDVVDVVLTGQTPGVHTYQIITATYVTTVTARV